MVTGDVSERGASVSPRKCGKSSDDTGTFDMGTHICGTMRAGVYIIPSVVAMFMDVRARVFEPTWVELNVASDIRSVASRWSFNLLARFSVMKVR